MGIPKSYEFVYSTYENQNKNSRTIFISDKKILSINTFKPDDLEVSGEMALSYLKVVQMNGSFTIFIFIALTFLGFEFVRPKYSKNQTSQSNGSLLKPMFFFDFYGKEPFKQGLQFSFYTKKDFGLWYTEYEIFEPLFTSFLSDSHNGKK